MDKEKLDYMEKQLRDCFKKKLEMLDVDGTNDYHTVKCVKTYGVLWHVVHQLQMAEGAEGTATRQGAVTTAQTMNVQATGLRMMGAQK